MNAFWQNLWYWIDLYSPVVLLVMAIVLLIFLAWLSWQQRQFARLRRHYRSLLAGGEGESLEAVLDAHMLKVREALAKTQELDLLVRELQRAGQAHLQHCGIVRFSPFAHTGGDQSFALALADAQGYGVVISSLHSRDSTRVYAKPLANWESAYPLTDEECQAMERARSAH